MSTPTRVLHVEDDADFADLTATFLGHHGEFDIEHTTTAEDGLERVVRGDFDCVVVDYELPGMDGIDFVRSVRAADADLPILMLTGRGDEEIASEAISAGVTDYLRKGSIESNYEHLARRLQQVVTAEHAEREVAEVEGRWRALVEHAPSPIVIFGLEGSLKYANDAALDLAGVDSFEAVRGASVLDFVADEDEALVLDRIEKLVTGMEALPLVEIDLVDTEGNTHVVGTMSSRTTFQDEPAIQTVMVDLTELRETERELVEERAFTAGALDALADILVVMGSDGELRRWNARLEQVTGYTDEELDAMDTVDLVEPEDQQRVEEYVERVFENGTATVEFDLLTKDGRTIPFEARGSRLSTGTEDGYAIVSIGRDLSEFRRLAREAEASQTFFETVFEGSFDAILLTNDDGYYVDANRAACELLGRDWGDVVGHHLSEFLPADYDVAAAWERFREAGTETGVVPLVRPDGDVRLAEYGATANILPGRHLSVLRDVTERRRQEAALERQNRRLKEFTSVVSHDLRNPLTVAQGYLQLARETGEAEHLERVERSHARMATLIEDLVALSRQGETVGETEAVALGDAARAAWDVVDVRQASLEVVDGPTLVADRSRLEQLLLNLFRNAVEHGGADVTVRVGQLEENHGFYVEDTGPGIPDAARDRLFEAGFTTKPGGTGFGLPIVKQIAEAHGWEIRVAESAEGGARFEFAGVSWASSGEE